METSGEHLNNGWDGEGEGTAGEGREPWPRRSHEEDLLKSTNKFAAGVVANEFIWTSFSFLFKRLLNDMNDAEQKIC